MGDPLKVVRDGLLLNHIAGTDLIGKCIQVAGSGEVEKCTFYYGELYSAVKKIGDLEIKFIYGLDDKGNGFLKVSKGKRIVLRANSFFGNEFSEFKIPCIVPPMDLEKEYVITDYDAGYWERWIHAETG